MTMSLGYLPFLILAPAVNAFLVQMRPLGRTLKKAQGEELCQTHGMSLPVLPTEDDWNDFLYGVRVIADSQGHTYDLYQVWLALTFEGTNATSPEHFTWANGQVATYLPEHDMDSNLTCVRMHNHLMRMVDCEWKRIVFCQGDVYNLSSSSPFFYMKRTQQPDIVTSDQLQTRTYFEAVTDPSRFPVPLNMRSMGVDWMDMVDCFHLCSRHDSCQVVAVLRDDTACFIQA